MTRSPRLDRTLCVAPMMAWTDRHCRYLHRLCAPNARLFTEMITTGAVLNGPRERLFAFDPAEHPVAVQLGGSDPGELAEAAKLATDAGFDEINLNVGCPSARVRQGRFGACLMREPGLVADCVAAMVEVTARPVTVKCRLGVDEADSDELLAAFVERVARAGSAAFYVHARKALLNGLSPAQNRSIPPLQPGRVYALKRSFPNVEIVMNGGVTSTAEARAHLKQVDGVMIGRAAYQNPALLAALDAELYAHPAEPVAAALEAYLDHIERELARGTRLHDLTRHLLGLFKGQPGARRFRRVLSDAQRLRSADADLVREALTALAARREAA